MAEPQAHSQPIETYGLAPHNRNIWPSAHNRNIWPYNSQAAVFCHAWPILLSVLQLAVYPLLGFLSRVFCPGFFCLESFVWGGFCPSPLLSEYIRYTRKLNITFYFRFNMYEKNLKRVTSHALGPPPSVTNCHTISNSLTPRA